VRSSPAFLLKSSLKVGGFIRSLLLNRSVGVNYVGHYWTVQQFLPAMLERGRGHIVRFAGTFLSSARQRLTCASALSFVPLCS
jgi:NAD(P)-dependent dehydrogenase (short-subunit alcohol dehydrogenase family)